MNMIYETCIVILWTVPDFPGRFSCTSGMIFKIVRYYKVPFKLKLFLSFFFQLKRLGTLRSLIEGEIIKILSDFIAAAK